LCSNSSFCREVKGSTFTASYRARRSRVEYRTEGKSHRKLWRRTGTTEELALGF
jgi:hypothetical protein